MLSQYKDIGIFTISIEDLKERLWIADKKVGVDKYPKYGLLRSKVLDPAKKELNEKSEFTFDYSETKTGRKYTHLVFSIKQASCKALVIPSEKKINTKEILILHKRLTDRYKLSPWQATKISDEVPSSEINKTLYEIQIEIANNKVHNIGGYTASIFDKK